MLAIVLSRKDIKEFDQTISLYTREVGKIEVLAKGVKKIISKNSANLEVLSVVEVETIKGKDIEYLTRVQPITFFKDIYLDLEKLYLATYICNITNRQILPGEKDEKIFNLLISFFDFINTATTVNSYQLATAFMVKLWHQLGFSHSNGKLARWIKEGWKSIHTTNVPQEEVVRNYELAYQFSQYHSGSKLAKFVENDRIVW